MYSEEQKKLKLKLKNAGKVTSIFFNNLINVMLQEKGRNFKL